MSRLPLRTTALTLPLLGLLWVTGALAQAAPVASTQSGESGTTLVLVAGATGSIGKHVVQDLLARGHRVRGLTRRPDSARADVPEVEWIGGDLRDRATLVPAVQGVTHIVYAAGAKSWNDPSNTSELID